MGPRSAPLIMFALIGVILFLLLTLGGEDTVETGTDSVQDTGPAISKGLEEGEQPPDEERGPNATFNTFFWFLVALAAIGFIGWAALRAFRRPRF